MISHNSVGSQITFYFGVGPADRKWTETWELTGLRMNTEFRLRVQHLGTQAQYEWCVANGELVGHTGRA
jgi:hypothetical protein